jgi:hypothetical protein
VEVQLVRGVQEVLCEKHGRAFPESLKRAHASIRAELKRLEAHQRSEFGIAPDGMD